MVEPTPFRKPVRVRYTKAALPRGAETIPISARVEEKMVRQVDEILAAQLDVELKTRSDVFHDALALWLSTWYDEHPNKLQSSRDEWELERKIFARSRRDQKLEQLREQVRRARSENDRDHIVYLLSVAIKLRMAYLDQKCSPTEKESIESVVAELRSVVKTK